MIEVVSYLKQGENFIAVADFNGSLKDLNYIEGAISLKIDHIEIINIQMWDYIDQLWSYILDGIERVNLNEAFECSFPDQPIILRLTPQGNRVLVSLKVNDEVKVLVDSKEFVNSLANHIMFFFKTLENLSGVDSHRYSHEIQRARILRTEVL